MQDLKNRSEEFTCLLISIGKSTEEFKTMENTPRTPLGSPSPYTPSGSQGRVSTASPRTPRTTTSLNDRLDTTFLNVGNADNSVDAKVTRTITGCVGQFVTPRRLLIVLRILKAITFCFLILNLAADMMYIVFLEITAEKEIADLAGGRRDLIIRIYGVFLAVVAICIELDYTAVVKSFYGFKGFIPRGLLYFFISAITGARPLHIQRMNQSHDDDAYAGDDDAYYGDDLYSALEIPQSAVVFQMVTSFIL